MLNVGCGLGGKTLAWREGGAAGVAGADILPGNVELSVAFAASRGTRNDISFVVCRLEKRT